MIAAVPAIAAVLVPGWAIAAELAAISAALVPAIVAARVPAIEQAAATSAAGLIA